MFDIGFSEMLLLGAIALIAVGPKQLPEVARTIGKMINEFRRATGDFTRTLSETRDSAIKSANEARQSYDQGFKQTSNQASDNASGTNAVKAEVQPSQAGSMYPHPDIQPQQHFGDTLGPDEAIFSPITPFPEEEQLAFSISEPTQQPEQPKRKEES